jgi:hypothetical protein
MTPAGALVAVSIVVMSVAAFAAFLYAIATIAAFIAYTIRVIGEVHGTAVWTVFINCTRCTASITDAIAVERLAAFVASLFDYAHQAILIYESIGFFKHGIMLTAFCI